MIYNKPTHYTSWRIQKELIELCANHINETIINAISTTGFFANMSYDAGRVYFLKILFIQCQYNYCSRFHMQLNLKCTRGFLGFVDVPNCQNVEAMYTYFERQQISTQNYHIVAQSYDGASVMSGNMKAKIKEQHSAAVYTHCMVYRLNLVVVGTCKMRLGISLCL